MGYKVTIEIPEQITFRMGGVEYTVRARDIADSSYESCLVHGINRRMNDGMSSAKNMVTTVVDSKGKKSKDESRWTAKDHDRVADELIGKLKNGNWGVRGESSFTDPVTELAESMWKERFLRRLAAAAKLRPGVMPRAATLRDAFARTGNYDGLAALDRFGAFSGKSGNIYTWDPAAVAKAAESLRDEAEAAIKEMEAEAESVDLSDLIG